MSRVFLSAALFVIVVLSLPTAALSAPASKARPDSPHVFVGVTTATIFGGAGSSGWKAMGNLCQAEFGNEFPSVRMCFSEEVMRTPTSQWPSDIPVVGAWTHPTFVSTNPAVDLSGVSRTTVDELSCTSWLVAAGRGLVTGDFGFATASCNFRRPVTCCAPIEEAR